MMENKMAGVDEVLVDSSEVDCEDQKHRNKETTQASNGGEDVG